jgi:type IX secretion system PorP/SprF family membrane protein
MKKIIITLCFTIAGFSSLFAQNEIGPALSSQLFSRVNFNPAGIGNDSDIKIFNMNRMQWAGFEGGPTYTLLNIQLFNEFLRSGFGGVFSYDQLGIANKAINAKIAYNYCIDLSEKALLSFGASGGILQKGNDFSTGAGHTYTPEPGMPEAESKINPDFDFGIEFATPALLVGASINHIGYMEPATSVSPTLAYYGYVRGTINVTDQISLAPSILYMNSGLFNVIDINTVAFYNKMYWAGLSLRLGAGFATMVGLEWKFLRVGYSYELSIGPTTINRNTHELMLSGKFSLR